MVFLQEVPLSHCLSHGQTAVKTSVRQ